MNITEISMQGAAAVGSSAVLGGWLITEIKSMRIHDQITSASAGHRLRYIADMLTEIAHQIGNSPIPTSEPSCQQLLAIRDDVWFIAKSVNPPNDQAHPQPGAAVVARNQRNENE